tara:strand:+ start:1720 stop:2613 length:894 start_codon:yes stop_codon:yes gene_type:complete
MSRITDSPVKDGDSLDAASLNTRFASYTQTDLNQFNHRDTAHDLPQFVNTGFMLTHAQSQEIGLNNWKHSSSVALNGMTTMPADASPVNNGSGTVTEMSFGALGINITEDEVFRAYWNLSVFANPGTKWNDASSLGHYVFPATAPGPTNKAWTWGAVWVTYLEWDVTSNSRGNYVAVPGQSDFKTVIAGKYGAALGDMQASAVVPADLRFADDPNAGVLALNSVQGGQKWRGISGAWFYTRPSGNVTCYGLRVVIKGIMHPFSNGSNNYLVHDTAYSDGASLAYNGGNLAVLKQRVK